MKVGGGVGMVRFKFASVFTGFVLSLSVILKSDHPSVGDPKLQFLTESWPKI